MKRDGITVSTTELHKNGRYPLEWSQEWLQAYDPTQTAVADAVADTGMVPDVLVRCENGHTLVEGWVMPDGRGVLRCHQTQVSQEWRSQLTFENRAYYSPRYAAAAGLEWLGRTERPEHPTPATVGFVVDESPGPEWIIVSCRCAQRWPFWISHYRLRQLLRDGTTHRIDLPIPEPCDCADCEAERHAAQLESDRTPRNPR